jgi:hypothetical protein
MRHAKKPIDYGRQPLSDQTVWLLQMKEQDRVDLRKIG